MKEIKTQRLLTGVVFGEINGGEMVKTTTHGAKLVYYKMPAAFWSIRTITVFYLVSQGEFNLESWICYPLDSCRCNSSCSHSLNRALDSLRKPFEIQYYIHWISISTRGNSAQQNSGCERVKGIRCVQFKNYLSLVPLTFISTFHKQTSHIWLYSQ